MISWQGCVTLISAPVRRPLEPAASGRCVRCRIVHPSLIPALAQTVWTSGAGSTKVSGPPANDFALTFTGTTRAPLETQRGGWCGLGRIRIVLHSSGAGSDMLLHLQGAQLREVGLTLSDRRFLLRRRRSALLIQFSLGRAVDRVGLDSFQRAGHPVQRGR